MSHAGLRIASLLKESGADVIAAVRKGSEFMGRLECIPVRVATGDLQDPDFLQSLGMDKAQSVIFPSEDDLFNLNAALEAVEINPDIRIILRLSNLNLGKKLEKSVRNFTVLSVSQLASSSLATAALIDGPIMAFESGEEILNLYNVSPASLSGKSLSDIEQGRDMKVVAINSELFPAMDRRVEAGDMLTVLLNGTETCEGKGRVVYLSSS
jgi:Trk K+ transport system NAD-binding subunit